MKSIKPLMYPNAQSISPSHSVELSLVLLDPLQHDSMMMVYGFQKRCTVPNQEHRVMTIQEKAYLKIGGNRRSQSNENH